ncbi:hypothetical protein ACU4GA_02745 [Methylobacterium oryzae CBMB20]
MSNLGLPVPPGFTITTEVCTYFYDHGKSDPPELTDQVGAALAQVGKLDRPQVRRRDESAPRLGPLRAPAPRCPA